MLNNVHCRFLIVMVGMLEEEKASKVTFGLVFQPILNQQYITTMLSINPAPKNDRHSKNLRKVGQTLTAVQQTYTHCFKFCYENMIL